MIFAVGDIVRFSAPYFDQMAARDIWPSNELERRRLVVFEVVEVIKSVCRVLIVKGGPCSSKYLHQSYLELVS
jgi:hypothetical protein